MDTAGFPNYIAPDHCHLLAVKAASALYVPLMSVHIYSSCGVETSRGLKAPSGRF